MNEPANFETNEERPWNWPVKDRPYWSLKCATNNLDDPPYKPRTITGDRLSEKTLCMVGLQTDGTRTYNHYDVHSLYGWSEIKPTLTGLRRVTGKRGIVISRSTYPGSGKDAGHWLGDNNSLWSHMKDSIVGMLEFNLFGIPYIGADICGFAMDTTKEMCQRWSLLGAFYPFSRNHNAVGQKDQDPVVFGEEVVDSTRRALRIRYSLLPVLYTLFYRAHTDGSTVVRSLMHQYPTDANTWAIDTQFLWGSDFMVAPVVEEAKLSRTVYFPDDIWYDYHTSEAVSARGQYLTVSAPMDHIPLYVRGGAILPRQRPANNTQFSRLNQFNLLVALDAEGRASGELFWDDGDSIDTIENGNYFMAMFSYDNTTNGKLLSSDITMGGRLTGLTISHVTILGVTARPTSVRNSLNQVINTYTYHPASKKLVIDELNESMDSALQIRIV